MERRSIAAAGRLAEWMNRRGHGRDEAGLTTAELLANAALGVGALAAVWAGLRVVGLDVVDLIRDQLL